MRREVKSIRNEILTHIKINSVYIIFNCGRNEVKFRFGWSEKNGPFSKASLFCFDEIKACADVSFHMISFWVVFTWYFITRNEISFLAKWPQWNDTRSEFHFGLYHLSSYKKLTRQQNENVSFCSKWNLM